MMAEGEAAAAETQDNQIVEEVVRIARRNATKQTAKTEEKRRRGPTLPKDGTAETETSSPQLTRQSSVDPRSH